MSARADGSPPVPTSAGALPAAGAGVDRRLRRGRAWALALAVVLTAGCAADRPKPTPLEPLTPKMSARLVWSQSLGRLGYPMVPAVRDGVVYVASGDGEVRAIDAASGDLRWRAAAGAALSAGVGSDGRIAAVVTRGNEVVAFENGRERWRKRIASSVVTPPLVAGERVFVLAVDRSVQAFDAFDGRLLWTLQRPGEALTLAQAGVLTAYRNTLVVGQGPRLAGVDPLRGTVQWEVPMASPRGTNEVERLADLVGPAVRVGDRLCLRAFQSAVACADLERGAVAWSRNTAGRNAVGADAELVFGADASDRVSAWRAGSGDVVWSSEKLLHRDLSGALAMGSVVVFGDGQGQLHFLSVIAGEQLLRLATDGKPVVGTPVLAAGTLVVTTQGGGLFAFRAE